MSDALEVARCKLCGEPMPHGEEMFFYHGYSGPCPKPPLPKPPESPPMNGSPEERAFMEAAEKYCLSWEQVQGGDWRARLEIVMQAYRALIASRERR